MLDQITQIRVADPLAEVKALEEERQRRLAEAREKRLVEKAALVARSEGTPVYDHGQTALVAAIPHPINQGDVVEVWLLERRKFQGMQGEIKEVVIESVVVWVRNEKDKNPRGPFRRGESWVQVLNLARTIPAKAPIKEQPYWTYIPGAWEEAISAKAGEIGNEIRERRQAKAAERVEELTRLLMPPRSV